VSVGKGFSGCSSASQDQGDGQVWDLAGTREVGCRAAARLHDEVVQTDRRGVDQGGVVPRVASGELGRSTLDVSDERANERSFGRPGASRGKSAYPRFALCLWWNAALMCSLNPTGEYQTAETTLAQGVLPWLRSGMLCLADRQFFGFELWHQARSTGADLLWRIKKNLRLPCEQRLRDGSYLKPDLPLPADRRHTTNA